MQGRADADGNGSHAQGRGRGRDHRGHRAHDVDRRPRARRRRHRCSASRTDLSDALDDVRDAVIAHPPRSAARRRRPIVSRRSTRRGQPIVTWTSLRRHDETELSWFVDDTVSRELLSVPGVGSVTRVGGVDARNPRRSRSGRMAALGPQRGRGLPPAAPDPGECPAARRASAARADRAHARTVNRAGDLPHCPSRSPTAAACGSTTIADVARHAGASARSWRCSTANRSSASQILRSRARARSTSQTASRKGVERSAQQASRPSSSRSQRRGRHMRKQYIATRWRCCSRARSSPSLVVWLFLRDWRATLCLGARAAAVDHPDVRGRCTCSASR